MRALSGILALVIACLVAAGVAKLRHYYYLTGTEFIGWAFVPFAILAGFTCPVTCKARRTNSKKTCGNWAYGLLFGCYDVAGHWKGKFLARLRPASEEMRPVARRPAGSVALYQLPPQSQPIKVTVEDGFRGKCGFWIAAASLVASVIQVIAIFAH